MKDTEKNQSEQKQKTKLKCPHCEKDDHIVKAHKGGYRCLNCGEYFK